MQIILLERIEKLGQMGDLVNVKTGFARNFLIPQGKALRANKANMERFEAERAQRADRGDLRPGDLLLLGTLRQVVGVHRGALDRADFRRSFREGAPWLETFPRASRDEASWDGRGEGSRISDAPRRRRRDRETGARARGSFSAARAHLREVPRRSPRASSSSPCSLSARARLRRSSRRPSTETCRASACWACAGPWVRRPCPSP